MRDGIEGTISGDGGVEYGRWQYSTARRLSQLAAQETIQTEFIQQPADEHYSGSPDFDPTVLGAD